MAETYRSDYRVAIELRHLPLHEAAMLNNARHIRLLPAGGKVNPQQTNTEGQYARELTEDAECRALLQQATGATPPTQATTQNAAILPTAH